MDTDHCSRKLMDHALNSDMLYSAKLGIKINKPFDYEYLTNTLTFQASAEMTSNFADTKYLKSKFFTRYLQAFGGLQCQVSLGGGIV